MIDSSFNKSYQKYYRIIEEAKASGRTKLKKDHPEYEYFENHHIIPDALGGSNKKSNMVLLTPEEHYICHSLLPDFCEGKSFYLMLLTWNMLNNFNNRKILIGPEKYGELKREFSERMTGSNHPRSKKIYQICKNTGIIIKEWSCITEAAKEFGVDCSNISSCIYGKSKSSANFIWCFPEDYNGDKIKEIQNLIWDISGTSSSSSKQVFQINKDTGIIVNKFGSISEAGRKLKLNPSRIGDGIKEPLKYTVHGFVWVEEKDYNKKLANLIKKTKYGVAGINNPASRIVYQIDIETNNIIKKWNYVNEAAAHLKIRPEGIRQCARSESKTYKGSIWIYKENYKETKNAN